VYISQKYKLLYVHANKCGGQSVTKLLQSVIPDLLRISVKGQDSTHLPLSWIPKQYRKWKVLLVIRHPMQRWESLYCHRRFTYGEVNMGLDPRAIEAQQEFNPWLTELIHKRLRKEDIFLSEYLDLELENLHIIKLENISIELTTFLRSIGVKKFIDLPKINTSHRVDIKWNDSLLELVKEKEAKIINQYY